MRLDDQNAKVNKLGAAHRHLHRVSVFERLTTGHITPRGNGPYYDTMARNAAGIRHAVYAGAWGRACRHSAHPCVCPSPEWRSHVWVLCILDFFSKLSSYTLTTLSDLGSFPVPTSNASTNYPLGWACRQFVRSFIQQIFVESLLCTEANSFGLPRDTSNHARRRSPPLSTPSHFRASVLS